MSDLEARIAKLPTWARDHIRDLELRPKILQEEVVKLRTRIDQLERIGRKKQDRIDAMVEMFQCAARGGNEVATAIKSIVEDFLTKED